MMFNNEQIKDRNVNELLGLCRGITSDGTVNKEEATYLHQWISKNKAFLDDPMTNILFKRIQSMLEDNHLDEEEKEDLLKILLEYTGDNGPVENITLSTLLPFDNPPPEIIFFKKSFCFSGTFAYGPKRICADMTKRFSAEISPRLIWQTDYLVVGTVATKSWAHSNYGRKIEQALYRKERGEKIAIVSEDTWAKALTALTDSIGIPEKQTMNSKFTNKKASVAGWFKMGSQGKVKELLEDLGATTTKKVTKTADYIVVGTEGKHIDDFLTQYHDHNGTIITEDDLLKEAQNAAHTVP
ncbi:MAG: hypothetical protein COA36_00290 [Desulfotalea sp.]|nr:MAG: hypothetical protein COA36_00290 [Desulfotalea sp.]